MIRLLVTGFGPFPGMKRNPSAVLAARLASDLRLRRNGVQVSARLVPTTWVDVDRLVPRLAAARPDAVLMLGVAARRRGLSIEMRARNRLTQHPDAAGRRAGPRIIAAGGGAVRPGRAPFRRLAVAASGRGMKARPSRDAGAYLCNYAYWRMLEALPASTPCVFVHVPRIGRGGIGAAADALSAIAGLLARRPQASSLRDRMSPGCGGGNGSSG